MTPKEAIQIYQCPGCTNDPFPKCYKTEEAERQQGCSQHHAGTLLSDIGAIFLGLPTGFNRLGPCKNTKVYIFESFEKGWGEYNIFNVPVWQYLDEHGNTIVRGLSPRINNPWIHIYLGDMRSRISCIEISDEELENMD